MTMTVLLQYNPYPVEPDTYAPALIAIALIVIGVVMAVRWWRSRRSR